MKLLIDTENNKFKNSPDYNLLMGNLSFQISIKSWTNMITVYER